MKITVEKCEECGVLFEINTASGVLAYEVHKDKENAIAQFNKTFPPVISDSNFMNGEYPINRTPQFYEGYKNVLISLVDRFGDGSDYKPLSYGWFRCLDDSNSKFYPLTYRLNSFCLVCYKEWGQPGYANRCQHYSAVDTI